MTELARGTGWPLRIEPRQSRRWRWAVLCLHLLGATGLGLSGLPLWAMTIGLALLGFSLWWDARHARASFRGGRIKAALLSVQGDWLLETARGLEPATLLPSSRIWPHLVILRFKTESARTWLVLPDDAMAAKQFRRLQIRLKHGF